MDLDDVAARLYALPPAGFTAAREAEARAAKDSGDVRLSREIAKLRRPTVSAWAVNQANREHPGELAELLGLGEALRTAWAAHDADALAELTRRRGVVTGRLAKLIRDGANLSASAATEVEQTLDAATVDAEAAGQVRQGRLVKALSYSGFAPAPAPPVRRRDPEMVRQEAEEVAARRAKELEEATAAYEEWRDALAQAVQERLERADKVARLQGKLTKAGRRLADAEQRLEVTRREEARARQRLERAK